MSIAKCCALLALRPLQTSLTSFTVLRIQMADQGVSKFPSKRWEVTEASLEDYMITQTAQLHLPEDCHSSCRVCLTPSPPVLEHYLAVHASQRLQTALPGNAAIQ